MSSRAADSTWFEFDRSAFRALFARQGKLFLALMIVASPLLVFNPRVRFDTSIWDFVPLWAALVMAAGIMGVGGALILVAIRATDRRVAIDLTGRRMRVGSNVVPFDEIDTASLVYPTNDSRQAVSIRFGRGRHHPRQRATIMLRRDDSDVLSADSKRTLLAALAACPIVRPSSPFDPTGRFASANFPGTLDRDGAVAVVEKPPRPGELLP